MIAQGIEAITVAAFMILVFSVIIGGFVIAILGAGWLLLRVAEGIWNRLKISSPNKLV